MFNLLKYFTKKKKNKTTVCSIDIAMNNDSSIETSLYWPEWHNISNDLIESIASEYAVMLHLLSNGGFKQDVMSTLKTAKQINNSEKDQFFLEKINENLEKLNKFNQKMLLSPQKNIPFISPTSVFKSSKI